MHSQTFSEEQSKTVNEYKFRVQKAEAEVSTLQANVSILFRGNFLLDVHFLLFYTICFSFLLHTTTFVSDSRECF